MFDTLEQRRLLSVSATFNSALGLIDVIGTDKPERIDVGIEYALVKPQEPTLDEPAAGGTGVTIDCTLPAQPTHFAVARRGFVGVESAVVSVTVNDVPLRRWTLPLSAVNAVQLTGAGGDDFLTLDNYATPIKSAVLAGDGHDVIVVTNAMGAPGSVAYGGDGEDTINLVSARGAFDGHVAYGDAGDDVIFGSENRDLIFGDDDGLRDVYVPQGNDLVFAAGGDDRVWGGGGNDSLHGDVGDDWLCGDDGADYLDGDDGHDTAVFDADDKFERIEHVTTILT